MTISSTIVVTRPLDEVWSFLVDLGNVPKWDRSIARATLISGETLGTDAVVETMSPGGKRQSFRVVAFERPSLLVFRLLRSPLFRSADLRFTLEPVDARTRITHEIDLRVRRWLPFLSPILSVLSRRALATDLDYLRRAVDEGFDLRTLNSGS